MSLLFCENCKAYRQHKIEKSSKQERCTTCNIARVQDKSLNIRLSAILEKNFPQNLEDKDDTTPEVHEDSRVSIIPVSLERPEQGILPVVVINDQDSCLVTVFLLSLSLNLYYLVF